MGENDIAKRILADLDRDVLPVVKGNLKTVTEFTENLQETIAKSPALRLQGAYIMHAGSSYEGVVVKEKSDFDIVVVLGSPYVSENFIVSREVNNFFSLKWKSVFDSPMTDKNGYLAAKKFRLRLFKHLKVCVERVSLPGADIQCRNGLASLDVCITKGGHQVSIDLAPQIACRSWGQCPELTPLEELPVSLRRYIDKLNKHASPIMFFVPAVPGIQHNERRLCNVAFSQLEKEFLASNPDIRNMVRLVKFVAELFNWKKNYNLKSFHIKRVAIKYNDDLQQKDLWTGYKALLGYIIKELNDGDIDGYLIRNQVVYSKSPKVTREVKGEIAKVRDMNAAAIYRLYQSKDVVPPTRRNIDN